MVLKRLDEHHLKINIKKSVFFQEQIECCGYVINKEFIQKSKTKINDIYNMKRPTNQSEVRGYLGLINYYARFFRKLSDLLYHLNKLLVMIQNLNGMESVNTLLMKLKYKY